MQKESNLTEFDAYSDGYTNALEDAVSFSGDDARYFADYKADQLSSIIDPGACAKILDYGCGVGNLSVAIHDHNPNWILHGFEISQDSLNCVPAALKSQGTFTTDLSDLDGNYDLTFLAGVMHHIVPENRLAALNSAVEHLKPGGKLVVFEHNPWNPVTRRVVDRCPFDENAILISAPDLIALFKSICLTQIQRNFIVFFPKFLNFLRPLERNLTWCPAGAQYAVIGKKPDV
mgnify:CR=1 FL=1